MQVTRVGARTGVALWTIVGTLMFSALGARAADSAHGKALFIACSACHSEKPDAIGPSLRGVFGRRSAALDDFRYSNPMKRANLVWDAANLRDYLINPQAKVKGNRMPFGGVATPAEADDLVAYLETYK
ncbi:MAG: c-type cytochrome [Bradyrhizobiaceae bacterium]|nr:c-type cytochrome [Bradyrhizobiaceae bacterium]